MVVPRRRDARTARGPRNFTSQGAERKADGSRVDEAQAETTRRSPPGNRRRRHLTPTSRRGPGRFAGPSGARGPGADGLFSSLLGNAGGALGLEWWQHWGCLGPLISEARVTAGTTLQ